MRHDIPPRPGECLGGCGSALADAYAAASLATEGFIHCTEASRSSAATFDRYYSRRSARRSWR